VTEHLNVGGEIQAHYAPYYQEYVGGVFVGYGFRPEGGPGPASIPRL